MKFQILFSEENKKLPSICRPLNLPRKRQRFITYSDFICAGKVKTAKVVQMHATYMYTSAARNN